MNQETSEVNIETILEEINRFSDGSDDRSVDEILREAELLLSEQQLNELNYSKFYNGRSFVDDKETEWSVKTSPSDMLKLDDYLDIISENISHVSKFCNNDEQQTFDNVETDRKVDWAETSQKIDTELNSKSTEPAVAINDSNFPPKRVEPEVNNSPKNYQVVDAVCDSPSNESQRDVYSENFISLPILSKQRSSFTPSLAVFGSKTMTPMTPSAFHSPSWSRERELDQQIERLSETLKDTEERLQSLRLQYDSVCEAHRKLEELNNQMQDEINRLKIDAQQSEDCTNLLRNELQIARKDRTDALNTQTMLRKELETSQSEKRRACAEAEQASRQISDLQRQCREMERIIARKGPDMKSLLLGIDDKAQAAANRRQLEQRITQLESEAREQDRKSQSILANVQSRFNSVQSKYETHISDLEMQVLSLQQINQILNEKIESRQKLEATINFPMNQQSCGIQTDPLDSNVAKVLSETNSVHTQTENKSPSKTNNFKKAVKLNVTPKEHANMMSTIRGMRVDIAIKEKALQRLNRELDECKETIRKLQRKDKSETRVLQC